MMKYHLKDDETFDCPVCDKNTFKKFFYDEENIQIGDYVGFCSNSDCSFCLLPEEFFAYRSQLVYQSGVRNLINLGLKMSKPGDMDYFISRFWATGLTRDNNLFNFLSQFFDPNQVEKIFNLYDVQTSVFDKWKNACIFWRIARDGRKLAYKLIQFRTDGERAGHRDPEVSILQHSLIDNGDGQRYCLFGLHLLNNPENQNKPICIVESEKTAIIASIVYPDGLWLSTGSSRYLNKMNIDDIPKNNIVLFPDPDLEGDINEETGKPDDWNERKRWFDKLKDATISGFMKRYVEENKTELVQEFGEEHYKEADIADYIVRTKKRNQQMASFEDIIKP